MKSGPKTPSVEADYTLYGFLKADFPDTLKHTLYTSVCARLADEFQDEDPRRAWQLSPHGALWGGLSVGDLRAALRLGRL